MPCSVASDLGPPFCLCPTKRTLDFYGLKIKRLVI